MRFKAKDWVATLLVAAIAVPYVGYLVRGEMPFIEDARGMSAAGLVLGIAGYLVMSRGDSHDMVGKMQIGFAVAGLALGIAALVYAETAAAELLLALFMASIAEVWFVEMVDHSGVNHWHSPTGVAR